MHRVDDIVPGFLSSRPNWLPPLPPHLQASVAPPRFGSLEDGGHTRLRERGRGEPIRTKEQTLWDSRYSIIPLRLEANNECEKVRSILFKRED